MKTVNNLPHLSTKLCLFIVVLLLSGCGTPESSLKLTSTEDAFLSNDIKGIVIIEAPKIGSLLHLRGIAGKGELITNQDGSAQCASSSIKFVAGDFGGSSIGIETRKPIRLVIYSDDIINRLIQGDKVVSKHYEVTNQQDDHHGDIRIESGLASSYGFVLREDSDTWPSWLESTQKIHCS